MLAAVTGVMVFGFWKVGKGIREQKYVVLSIYLQILFSIVHYLDGDAIGERQGCGHASRIGWNERRDGING
jgi:hypothetical protein